MKLGIIYKIVNTVNGKIYVGRDKHNNPKYMGSGVLINLAFIKYGIENFKKEIIEECEEKNLDEREKFWIKKLNSQDKNIGYNIAGGGYNDFIMNDYVKSKISKTLRGKYIGENSFRHGLKLSDDHKKKFTERSCRIKGKTYDEIFGIEKSSIMKTNLSKIKSGVKLSKKHCDSISKAKMGIPLSEKQKKGISEGMKGRIVTDYTKEKLRNSNINKTQKHSKKLEVKNLITNELFVFNNVEHAKRTLNCTRYQLLNNKLENFEIKILL